MGRKKVLELCNSERFNIRRQEVEQYWNRVIRSKKGGRVLLFLLRIIPKLVWYVH